MNIDELKETRDTFAVWGYETLLSDELIEKIISILDAEIARQSVTDEDVKRAIHSIKEHMQLHRLRNYPQLNIGHALDLAITALQQMRTEGCNWCRNHTDMTVDGYANGTGTDVCLDVISFCPVCGKELGVKI